MAFCTERFCFNKHFGVLLGVLSRECNSETPFLCGFQTYVNSSNPLTHATLKSAGSLINQGFPPFLYILTNPDFGVLFISFGAHTPMGYITASERIFQQIYLLRKIDNPLFVDLSVVNHDIDLFLSLLSGKNRDCDENS